jgi:SAM-dependent methyltransferase
VPAMLEARLWAARGRRNVQRAVRPLGSAETLIPGLASGKSFVDVGALWNVHGRIAFLAEESGATAVTAMDVSPETDPYREEHARRASKVRFVQGDLHDDRVLDEVGPHDVVWCSGVLYHCPNPIHSLECLRRLTRETLVLITATLPDIAGSRQAGVFFPALSEAERRSYDRAYNAISGGVVATRVGLTTPFDARQGYANWWWGLAPSAVEGMLAASGFAVAETKTNGFHTRIVARVI